MPRIIITGGSGKTATGGVTVTSTSVGIQVTKEKRI